MKRLNEYCPKCGCSRITKIKDQENAFTCNHCKIILEHCKCALKVRFIANVILVSPIFVLAYIMKYSSETGAYPEVNNFYYIWIVLVMASFIFKQKWNFLRIKKGKLGKKIAV